MHIRGMNEITQETLVLHTGFCNIPHCGLQTFLHVAETSTFRERTEADVTRETMAASEISVEESGEGEELAAKGGDGKLSLRMKVVTPVEEGSSEHFSLQSKKFCSHLSPLLNVSISKY